MLRCLSKGFCVNVFLSYLVGERELVRSNADDVPVLLIEVLNSKRYISTEMCSNEKRSDGVL